MSENLIQRLQAGEQAAFVELIRQYQDQVVNTCFGFLRSEEDARDTAQEVFVEVFLSIRRFREDAALSTWIFRIAVNKSLDLIRKKNRKKRFAFLQALTGADPAELDRLSALVPTPASILEARESRNQVDLALQKIPENQRIAWILHKVEGLSHAEIAGIMDTTVPAVESLIHRAKNNLIRYFE